MFNLVLETLLTLNEVLLEPPDFDSAREPANTGL
jgi:hypothetical protein